MYVQLNDQFGASKKVRIGKARHPLKYARQFNSKKCAHFKHRHQNKLNLNLA